MPLKFNFFFFLIYQAIPTGKEGLIKCALIIFCSTIGFVLLVLCLLDLPVGMIVKLFKTTTKDNESKYQIKAEQKQKKQKKSKKPHVEPSDEFIIRKFKEVMDKRKALKNISK